MKGPLELRYLREARTAKAFVELLRAALGLRPTSETIEKAAGEKSWELRRVRYGELGRRAPACQFPR